MLAFSASYISHMENNEISFFNIINIVYAILGFFVTL
nr:MAG TPA: hypothetical protein [Bacteriophage sp.]DAX08032.1 MAG TPA: hypothetical protein [Bacteriophage sp.]